MARSSLVAKGRLNPRLGALDPSVQTPTKLLAPPSVWTPRPFTDSERRHGRTHPVLRRAFLAGVPTRGHGSRLALVVLLSSFLATWEPAMPARSRGSFLLTLLFGVTVTIHPDAAGQAGGQGSAASAREAARAT